MNFDLSCPRAQWRRAFHMACLLLALTACQPESAKSDDSAKRAEIPFGAGLLWKIEKEGLEPSYVFATIHLIDPRLCSLPPIIRQAFDSSPRSAFEFVPTPEAEAVLANAVQLQSGRTLEEILGAELFQRAAGSVSHWGHDKSSLQRIQPWLLASMLNVSPAEVAHQSRGVLALDIWLQHRARQQGKEVVSLVEVEELVRLHDEMSEEDQIVIVRDLVAAFPQIDVRVERRFAAYLDGDLARLMAEAYNMSGSSDLQVGTRLSRLLVEARRQSLVERMPSLVKVGATFFSIDAALLPGEEGILRLLERRGFTITRLH